MDCKLELAASRAGVDPSMVFYAGRSGGTSTTTIGQR
jgi:hypothetical protein